MKRSLSFFCTISLQILVIGAATAQSKNNTNTLLPPPADIKIDGSISEWGDSLRYYNAEKKLNYTLANDKDNVYMAIRLNDRTEQERILGAGLTLSIDTKGKKKEEFTLTFPVAEAGATGRFPGLGVKKPDGDNNTTEEDHEEMRRARLTKLRNIKVTGFKDIEDGTITTNNTYGIKVAINYDDNGYLVYEAAIPLKFFGEFKADKDEWAFNFKINGLTKPTEGGEGHSGVSMGGGGRGGMGGGGGMRGGGGGMGGGRHGGGGGGMRGGGSNNNNENGKPVDRAELFKSVDFWEKYYLAK